MATLIRPVLPGTEAQEAETAGIPKLNHMINRLCGLSLTPWAPM